MARHRFGGSIKVEKQELNKRFIEALAKVTGLTIEEFFTKIPKMMGWDDDKVLEILGYELGEE